MSISPELTAALRKANLHQDPDCSDLATILRQAILADLEKIEKRYNDHRAHITERTISEAEMRDRLAREVRVCLVTAQVAINRALGL